MRFLNFESVEDALFAGDVGISKPLWRQGQKKSAYQRHDGLGLFDSRTSTLGDLIIRCRMITAAYWISIPQDKPADAWMDRSTSIYRYGYIRRQIEERN